MKGCKAFIKHFSDTKKNCEHKNLPKFSLFKFQLPQRVIIADWDIAEVLQTCYFGYFGNDSLRKPAMVLSAWGKLWCSSSCKKWNLSLTSFLKYCMIIFHILKNPAIWLAEIILAHNLQIRIFPGMEFLVKHKKQHYFSFF